MKKLILVIFAVVFLLAFVGCNNHNNADDFKCQKTVFVGQDGKQTIWAFSFNPQGDMFTDSFVDSQDVAQEITKRSGNLDPGKMETGQTLHVPAKCSESLSQSEAQIHKRLTIASDMCQKGYIVEKGDSLSGIAQKFPPAWSPAVRTAKVAISNSLTDPDKILVGQKLQLPADMCQSVAGAIALQTTPTTK